MLRSIACLIIISAMGMLDPAGKLSESDSGPGSRATTQAAELEIKARFRRIADILRPRTTSVEVWGPVYSNEFTSFSNKLLDGVAAHPKWWTEYVSEYGQKTGSLPYHPNMGLTKQEYATYLRLAEKVEVKKTATMTLVIRQEREGQFLIHSPDESANLGEIKIDLAHDSISTVAGRAERASPLDPDAKLTGLGPWNGFQWKAVDFDSETQTGWTLAFSIGHLASVGRGVIYYKAKKVDRGRTLVDARRVLVFPAEGATTLSAGNQTQKRGAASSRPAAQLRE